VGVRSWFFGLKIGIRTVGGRELHMGVVRVI